jgi:hypothetical protein
MADELRGVIDRFEGDLAAIVFDDDQRLDLPRSQLPKDARSGDAIVIRLTDSNGVSAAWKKSGVIEFVDGQSIKWPGKKSKGEVRLAIEVDAEDTEARKKRVRGLLDDIFKKGNG